MCDYSQCNPDLTWRIQGCPLVFQLHRGQILRGRGRFFNFCSTAFSGGHGLAFVAVPGLVLVSAEHTEIVLPAVVLFFLSKTAVFA